MSELVTEARVEHYVLGLQQWVPACWLDGRRVEGTVPEMVEAGRSRRRQELETRHPPGNEPIRVVDSAGTVVAQWGRP